MYITTNNSSSSFPLRTASVIFFSDRVATLESRYPEESNKKTSSVKKIRKDKKNGCIK